MIDTRNYSADERLKNGTPVIIRAIRSDDKNRVLSAFRNLDRESIYTRFFAYKRNLTDAELTQITEVDFASVVALVATTATEVGEKLVGGGRYCSRQAVNAPRSAELAFVTVDDHRGLGIASLILRHLTQLARDQGILQFEADVLSQNRAMLAVFRRTGLSIKEQSEGNSRHITLFLEADPTLRQRQ